MLEIAEANWREVDLTREEGARWDEFQARAFGGTLFHHRAWLQASAEAARMRLRPMVLERNGAWIGTVPLFERGTGPLRICLTPPPRLGIPFMGPTLDSPSAVRSAPRESSWQEFASSFIQLLHAKHPGLLRVILSPGFHDVRPFVWDRFKIVPKYRYVLDLQPKPDDLLKSLPSSTRKRIRQAEGKLTFREGGLEDAIGILEGVRHRYRAQQRNLGISSEFLTRLFASLPSGSLRIFLVEKDGRLVTGVILSVEGSTVRTWEGAYRPANAVPGATEFLYWSTMVWARERGTRWFDFLGANTPPIATFKGKFNPFLDVYYLIERASLLARFGVGALKTIGISRRAELEAKEEE